MIKAFIFDIGNVLLPFDFSVALEKLREKSGIDQPAVAMEPVKLAYESGQLTRGQFVEALKKALRYSGTDEELITAWADIFTENVAMSELVRQLEPHYPLYLLSNTNDIHMDHVFSRYPVFHLFKDAVYSHRVKAFKPDPRIFEIALEQFGLVGNETVYIDDLEFNVAAARKLGMRAILYDYNRHGDLMSELKGMGALAVNESNK